MMDDRLLPLLPSLIALIEERGVSAAARRLGLSQPRMSARLRELRHLLDDPLLVASSRHRGLLPTDRALALVEGARVALADLDHALSDRPFDPLTARRTFSIMANDNAATIVGRSLAQRVPGPGAPHLRLALHAHDPARLGQLETGRLDIVIGSPGQIEAMPALISRVLLRDRFVTVTAAADPVLDMDAFCSRPHVIVSSDGGGFSGIVDDALAAHGRSRHVALSVQSYLLALELVSSGGLVATLPRALVASSFLPLRTQEPPVALTPFTLVAAWHPRSSNDPALRWLRDQVFDAVGQP